MHHNEEFRKDIEKVERAMLDISLYSMPFIVPSINNNKPSIVDISDRKKMLVVVFEFSQLELFLRHLSTTVAITKIAPANELVTPVHQNA